MTDSRGTALPGRIPVSVLTGFLGSGKTTILSRLIRHPGMDRVACVINEFGEVGLDHHLLRQSEEEVVLMDSGCLCCTIRGDLVNTMRDLILAHTKGEIPPFERVVVETTGLADPAPILHTIMTDPLMTSRFRLDGVIATIDAVNGAKQLDEQPEPVKQLAMADRILVTKTDLVEGGDTAALEARIHAINPAATLIPVVHGEVDPARLLDAGLYNPEKKGPDVMRWLKEEAFRDAHDHHHTHDHGHDHDHSHDHNHDHNHEHHHPHDVNRHGDGITSFCLRHDSPLVWERVIDWLDAIITARGDDVLRIKGMLNVTDSDVPVAIHGIHHVFHPPMPLPAWPDADHSSRIVFITRGIEQAWIKALFEEFVLAGQEEAAHG